MAKSVATYHEKGQIVPADAQAAFKAHEAGDTESALDAGLIKDSKARAETSLAGAETKPGSVAVVSSGKSAGKRGVTGIAGKASVLKSVGQIDPSRPRETSRAVRAVQAIENIKDRSVAKVVDEFDKSDELQGVSSVYTHGKTISDIYKAHQRARAAAKAQAGATNVSSATPRVSTSAKDIKAARKQAAKKANKERIKRITWKKSREIALTKQASAGANAATATGKAGGVKTIGVKLAGAAGPVLGVIGAVIAFVLSALLVSQLISALFGFWQNEAEKQTIEGLPTYITYDMVEAALQVQEDYGHPAGCTIAQIIVESGCGDTMRLLATRDHNLFGMKWSSSFALAPEVTGKASWVTQEEYDGVNVTITDYFTVFKSDADCITFRSRVFLAASRYANNSLIQEAIAEHSSDKMAEGLKDAGWATSSSYVESLTSVMDTYNLRRFDTMTVDDLANGTASTDAIITAAMSQLGVNYVWGGTTPGVGLDCSGLTQYCYKQAGISIPRNSEDQYKQGTKKPVSQAEVGDILWRPGHVAIYIGGDSYIHAPYSGTVVQISSGISYFTAAVSYR